MYLYFAKGYCVVPKQEINEWKLQEAEKKMSSIYFVYNIVMCDITVSNKTPANALYVVKYQCFSQNSKLIIVSLTIMKGF